MPIADSFASDTLRKPLLNDAAVDIVEVSKEWGSGSSVSSSLASQDPLRNRLERYARMNKEIAKVSAGPQDGGADSGNGVLITPNVIRSFNNCFLFVETYLHMACLILMAWYGNWYAVACLLPSHALVVGIEIYCVRQDREVAQLRQELKKEAYWRLAVFEAAVIVVGGLFCGYPLVRARRCLREGDRSFLDEIEQSDAGLESGARGLRFDTHTMLVSDVPRVVVLTNRLISEYWNGVEVAMICAAVAMALVNMVQAVVNFDYYTSRYVRGQYESRSSCCEHQLLPVRFMPEFRTAHYVYRSAEILGRTLTLVANALVFHIDARLGMILLLSDYLLGLVALKMVTGSSMIIVLSIDVFVANVFRYLDEHGLAMQARKVSFFLWVLRNVQFCMAFCLYYYYAEQPNDRGAVEGNGARRLAEVVAAAQFSTFIFLRFTKVGHIAVDFFVAAKLGDVQALEEMLRTGLDPDIKQGILEETAMHVAVSCDQNYVIRVLLENGADPLLLNNNDENPLHIACRRGNSEAIELLLTPTRSGVPLAEGCRTTEFHAGESGERCDAAGQVNKSGETPLQVLKAGVPFEVAQMLAEAQKASNVNLNSDVTGHLSRSISQQYNDLSQTLFGPQVGGNDSRLWFGSASTKTHKSEQKDKLAAFMLSTGIGEQMASALDSMQETDDCSVRLSALKIQGHLGAGAFGKVIKVLDSRTAEVYAMKLQKRTKATKVAVREAQAMYYSHAFITKIVHIFQTKTFYCILMECCERNLNKCILDHADLSTGYAHGLPEEKTARYAACVSLALESLHHRRIVFRDLKPENILVTSADKGDVAKLTDFGLARPIDPVPVSPCTPMGPMTPGGYSVTDDGSPAVYGVSDGGAVEPIASDFPKASPVSGTLSFMPDEVWREAEAALDTEEDPSTKMKRLAGRDWYALGCCLLLMLLGQTNNRRVTSEGRDVLLPPPTQQDLWVALRVAAKNRDIDPDAFLLVSSLTAAWEQRGDGTEVKNCPFMKEAVQEMEILAGDHDTDLLFGGVPEALSSADDKALIPGIAGVPQLGELF